ncbi:MAG: hypothetical protein NTX03_15435 [Bacteroidetes bacterium]|nr:hypothetical protein [Bacteroidota bacterium]
MKNLFLILSLVLMGMLLNSCRVDPYVDEDWNKYYRCNEAKHWDSTTLAAALVGTWNLKLSRCGECDRYGSYPPDKKVVATFTPNTFKVTENSILVTGGKWSLERGYKTDWYFSSDTSHYYLHGLIWLCDNHVVFASSASDGVDNLFERVK